MAKTKIAKKRKKRKQKKGRPTAKAPLCALGEVVCAKHLFDPIHQGVSIEQKTVVYRPTDKLVFPILGILAGAETLSEINIKLRPDKVLLNAFGYNRCADISVIQQTLDAATETTVCELESALDAIWDTHTRSQLSPVTVGEVMCVDIDLSALPVSKRAEGSEKGYVANRGHRYTRQLARVLVSETQEIVSQSVYNGKMRSDAVFKEMVGKLEQTMQLDSGEKRGQIQLRFDAGFGTDANINYALWRGYEVLGKMYAWKRVKKLANTVERWESVPTSRGVLGRDAGWVSPPHRYARNTVQVAVRTQKQDGSFSYAVLVTTKTDASIAEIVRDYDKRSGAPESRFSQDYAGLSLRKYRKSGFVAQQVLVLLCQLAHNLLIWVKEWLSVAVMSSNCGKSGSHRARTGAVLEVRGMKRLIRDILSVSGAVCFENHRVVCIRLNPLHPLIVPVTTAFEALLQPYNIRVLLDKN